MNAQPCFPSFATRALLNLTSEKWVLLILEQLRTGPVRFLELQRRVGDISQKSLTQTVRRLQKHGIVTRTVFAEVPLRVEYCLTDIGQALTLHLQTLRTWADAHADGLQNSSIVIEMRTHKPFGISALPVSACMHRLRPWR